MTMKTRIFLSWLASLLAVLVTGCEPIASPEVNADPLVGERGTESLIGIPTPGEFFLADDDEDDPDENESWDCDDVRDCWDKCEEWDNQYDSGASSCKCKAKKGGGWSCDAKWWEDGPGDDDGGGGAGCGGGGGPGGIDGEDPLLYCPSPPINIDGFFNIERGTQVTYHVRMDQEWDTMPNLTFRWTSGNNTKGGMGKWFGHTTWEGVATRTQGIEVVVAAHTSSGYRRGVSRKTIKVRSRPFWDFLLGTSGLTAPETVQNGWGTKWGQYERGWDRNPNWQVGAGKGPWEGGYYLEELPELDFPDGVYWHPDLTTIGPKYNGADQTCDSVSVKKANLLTVNGACGFRDAFNDLRTLIGKHEFRHQGSLNECLTAINSSTEMRELESRVFSLYSDVEQEAQRLWDVWSPKMVRARRTTQSGQETPKLWHYRQTGAWKLSKRGIKGHYGTEGCSI